MLTTATLRPLCCYRNFVTKTKRTLDPQEVKRFEQNADNWWDESGVNAPLHSLNKCRIPWIRNRLTKIAVIDPNINPSAPFKGLSLLEVGCGGGILSEPLSRLGCDVTGLDASEKLINLAEEHAKTQKLLNVRYVYSTIQEYADYNKEIYDVVVSSETIEHVTEKEEFVKGCVQCLKPGGSLFITTQNKTWMSKFFVIFMAEDVLKIVPKGTHTYDMFIHLHDLKEILKREKCEILFTSGMFYNPLANEWFLTEHEGINYVIHAKKSQFL